MHITTYIFRRSLQSTWFLVAIIFLEKRHSKAKTQENKENLIL